MDEAATPAPPSPARVAARALVLAAVSCRGFVERDDDAVPLWSEVRGWFATLGADSELEPAERALLDAPLGALSASQRMNASWRCEGMAVLAWALGGDELPPYDAEVDPRAVADALGFLRPRDETVLTSPRLRPRGELAAFAEGMFTVHWRLREQRLNPAAMDLAAFARTAWFGPLSLDLARLSGGDLAIGGRPIARADDALLARCESIASERRIAARWLLGDAPVYSEVDTST